MVRALDVRKGLSREIGLRGAGDSRGPRLHDLNGERYGVFHDLQGWRVHMTAAGFTEPAHDYRPPGLPFEQQPWLATVFKAEPRPPPHTAPARARPRR